LIEFRSGVQCVALRQTRAADDRQASDREFGKRAGSTPNGIRTRVFALKGWLELSGRSRADPRPFCLPDKRRGGGRPVLQLQNGAPIVLQTSDA